MSCVIMAPGNERTSDLKFMGLWDERVEKYGIHFIIGNGKP